MLNVYRLLMRLAYAGVYPFARYKAAQGDAAWTQRLNLTPRRQADIWLHAASVGEVRMISYLVDYLRANHPDIKFHISVMTRTGHETAVTQFAGPTCEVTFLPIDMPHLVKKAFDQLHPKVLVIAETEIWPNLLTEAYARSCPVVLVNGRITEKAFKQYWRFSSVLEKPFKSYARVFVKTEGDKQRFLQLGLPEDRAEIAGDMKFDAPVQRWSAARIQECRSAAGIPNDAFLLTAGSTRPGEEEIVLSSYASLRETVSNIRLVIAPRHLERLPEVTALVKQQGLQPVFLADASGGKELSSSEVLVVDRLGILNDFYAIADLAVVGGTLVPLGGHNVLEPVWVGTPVLFGPSLFTVQEAADYIQAHRYGAQVTDGAELTRTVAGYAAGTLKFARKDRNSEERTATATAGDFILSLMSNV